MATRYAWTGRSFPKLDAQVAGEHIEALVEKYKEHLTAEEILADARRAQSPLHEVFTWDDSEAAEKYRRNTARAVVTNLVVKSNKSKKTRAFVYVRLEKHGRKCYVPVRSAMAQPELKQQVITQAYKELERWIGRFGGDRALRFVHRDVERLRRKIEVEYLTAAGIAA